MAIFFAVVAGIVAIIAGWLAWMLYERNQQRKRRPDYRAKEWPLEAAPPPIIPRKTPEQELLDRQLEAVKRQGVNFYRRPVMNRGEYQLFCAALDLTRQRKPTGEFAYWSFPQVSLGEIIGTERRGEPDSDEAYWAINSKRCDLLIADRNGIPIAVFEYQGSGHDLDGAAKQRDEIKRIALERAGVKFIEIRDGTPPDAMQQTMRDYLLTRQQAPKEPERPMTTAFDSLRPGSMQNEL